MTAEKNSDGHAASFGEGYTMGDFAQCVACIEWFEGGMATADPMGLLG